MDKRERVELVIPDTPAGHLAADAFYRLAVELCEEAGKATMDFMLANFPGARSIRRDYANGQHTRTIEAGGETHVVIYDFKTKTTRSEVLLEEINKGEEEGLRQTAAVREARKKKAV
jgi:hypothetical protein